VLSYCRRRMLRIKIKVVQVGPQVYRKV
jgi:hypothetical protein